MHSRLAISEVSKRAELGLSSSAAIKFAKATAVDAQSHQRGLADVAP